MSLTSQREAENARRKLERLEHLLADAAADTAGQTDLRETEMESLQRQINLFKEELARYESRQMARR